LQRSLWDDACRSADEEGVFVLKKGQFSVPAADRLAHDLYSAGKKTVEENPYDWRGTPHSRQDFLHDGYLTFASTKNTTAFKKHLQTTVFAIKQTN
jgi:hypothetical protein